MVSDILGAVGSRSARLRRSLWKLWYELLAGRYRQPDWKFMNYGYAPVGPEGRQLTLDPADEPDRYSIQLYDRVAAVDLTGAAVLEVGCGRGGGCSYVARYLRPASMLGVDLSARAVEFCSRVNSVPNLSFRQGEAEALPCPDAAFDAVLNVESSHCYASVPAFAREVFRVLRPGGHLLWADMRAVDQIEATRRHFTDAGFLNREENVITPQVLHALDLTSDRRTAMIRRLVPAFLHRPVQDFAGVSGTRVYESLRAGGVQYLHWVLQKPHP